MNSYWITNLLVTVMVLSILQSSGELDQFSSCRLISTLVLATSGRAVQEKA